MTPAELIEAAKKAYAQGYAPYSDYRVGAALLCSDGTVITGCNVENSSYGLSSCAERTAVFTAIASGKRSFSAIAIAASKTPVPFPCGACRQVLSEFCDKDFSVHVAVDEGYATATLGELFPHGFSL